MSFSTVPKGRSARTPPPTLLFLSSLVKEQIPPHPRQEQNPDRPSRLPEPRSLRQVSHPVAAVDEGYLIEPGRQVNTRSEEILNSFRVFIRAMSDRQSKSVPRREISSELY
jgi:hypothetical protein